MIYLITFFGCACAGFGCGWALLGVVKFDEGRLVEARKWQESLRELQEEITRLKSKLVRQREIYIEGLKEGVKRYAWWKDGKQQVGTCGTSLKSALETIDSEG